MDEIEEFIHTADTDTGTSRLDPNVRRTYVGNRVMTDAEVFRQGGGPRVPPISGAYVHNIRSGDKDEMDRLRAIAERRSVKVEPAWDAARLRQELGFDEGQPVSTSADMPESRAIDPAQEPRGEGSTASGAPAIQAHPGHGTTASGSLESYDPGYGATSSGSIGVPPEEGWVMPKPGEITEPPVNRDVPAVFGPDGFTAATVGQSLECTMGNWENEPTTYVYQWMRDDAKVGIGQSTYLTTAADADHSITCVVSALNRFGLVAAPPSNAIQVTAAAPASAQAPAGTQTTTPPPRTPGVTEPPPRPTTPQQSIPQRSAPGVPGQPQQQPTQPVAAAAPQTHGTPPRQPGAPIPQQPLQRPPQPTQQPSDPATAQPAPEVPRSDSGTLTRPAAQTAEPTPPQQRGAPRQAPAAAPQAGRDHERPEAPQPLQRPGTQRPRRE